MNNVKVVNIKSVEGFDSLKGFADIVLNSELTLKSFRILQDANGLWVGFPQSKYEAGGKTKYAPIIEASEQLRKQIQQVILEAYNEQ